MSSDEAVAAVARRSRIGRAGQRLLARLRADAHRSVPGAAWRLLRARASRIGLVERFRLAGVSIVTAIATNALLLGWSPPITVPAAPPMLSVVVAAAGLALILLADPIARGWERSWLRRRYVRARGSNAANSERA